MYGRTGGCAEGRTDDRMGGRRSPLKTDKIKLIHFNTKKTRTVYRAFSLAATRGQH